MAQKNWTDSGVVIQDRRTTGWVTVWDGVEGIGQQGRQADRVSTTGSSGTREVWRGEGVLPDLTWLRDLQPL